MAENSLLSNTFIRIARYQVTFFTQELSLAEQAFNGGRYSEDEYSLLTRLLRNDIEKAELRLQLYKRSAAHGDT